MSNVDSMPTSYNAQYDPNYSGSSGSSGIIQTGWLKSPPAWIKLAQIAVGLICFICATVAEAFVKDGGGGWVQFVAITTMIITIIITILYLFNIITKLPAAVPWPFIEMIYSAGSTLCYFIAGVVAAAMAEKYEDATGAAAFFAFVGMILFGVESFLLFTNWRQSHPSAGPAAQTTTTTTTSTMGTSDMSPGVHPGHISVDYAEKGQPAY